MGVIKKEGHDLKHDAIMHLLEPLLHHLTDPRVSDVLYNGRGQWYLERQGCWEEWLSTACDDQWARRFIALLAHHRRVCVGESHPFLSTTLSIGARVQCVLPPVSPYPIIAIRLLKPSLAWHHLRYDQIQLGEDQLEKELASELSEDSWSKRLEKAMTDKETMLLSGATGTGKTTLLRGLLSVCEPSERVIVLEDSPELHFPESYHTVLLRAQPESAVCGLVNMADLLRVTLRLRPDRIVVGEIRGGEAYDFLSACQTGHSGLLATIHANDPDNARKRLAQLCMANPRCGAPLSVIQEWVNHCVPMVVQCTRQRSLYGIAIRRFKGEGHA